MSRHRGNRGGLFPGVIMIIVGTAFLLERFDVLSLRQVWQLWPLFVIGIGLIHLLWPRGGRRSIFVLLLGIWFQISTLELWGLDFSDSWPLMIIFVGASFVFDALLPSGAPPDSRRHVPAPEPSSDTFAAPPSAPATPASSPEAESDHED